MRRFFLAVRAFFRTLFNATVAERVRAALDEQAAGITPVVAPPPPALPPKRPARSEAVTLLAALQREGRFVDFVMESLDTADDTTVGAVARNVHRGCRQVVERFFAPEPVLHDAENSELEVPAGFDAGRYRLVGNVTGEPPHRGTLTHHGWQAGRVEMPEWSGNRDAARVVAPAEVELK
ncbi:MAG: DUF2760 domain-containing protein [Planctomycetes bacterium]|nr:DUF2760 domain-containing protein [Planctomycetota bacterium]